MLDLTQSNQMKKSLFEQYIVAVCSLYSLSEEVIFSRSKKHLVSEARHFLYYLCFNRNMRIIDIQTYMEEKGYKVQHSSVIHGIQGISTRVGADKDYRDTVVKIQDSVKLK